jgi:hypothetical protein
VKLRRKPENSGRSWRPNALDECCEDLRPTTP